jgi:hypothetical protein
LTFFNFFHETTSLVLFGFQTGRLDQGLTCKAPAPDHKYKCGISNADILSFKTITVTHCPSFFPFSNLMMWMKWRLLDKLSTAATGSINLFLQTGQTTQFCLSRPIPYSEKRHRLINEFNWLKDFIMR